MRNVKSHAPDLIRNLVTETLADAHARLLVVAPQHVRKHDFGRDQDYLTTRLKSEGLTFATTTLPHLGEWLDSYVLRNQDKPLAGFEPHDGIFPKFLRPFWIYIQECKQANRAIDATLYRILRTLLHGLKKLEISFTQDQVDQKLSAFLKIEEELSDWELYPTANLQYARDLLDGFVIGPDSDTFRTNPHASGEDNEDDVYVPRCEHPRHGPGAVAGGERDEEKWRFAVIYSSVHAEFPWYDYIYPIRSLEWDTSMAQRRSRPLQLLHGAAAYAALDRQDHPVARLLFVPKDSRGPRIISCEPLELMYLQQGVATHLVRYIEQENSLTRGRVNFADQSINAQLAKSASFSRRWATIDLSDASDRVSCKLIRFLFPKRVWKKWLALRSHATLLPDGRKLPLEKFAPMGSALCFPVESLCFWALCVAAIWRSSQDLSLAVNSVYVYGDDIIVADEYAELVMESLTDANLKVNVEKSFYGEVPFRESCGIEAYYGHDVTPYRVRKLPPLRSTDGTAIVAWTKYAELCQAICPRRASYCLKVVEALTGPIPRVPFEQPYLSVVTPAAHWTLDEFKDATWCGEKCYYQSKLWVVTSKKRRSRLDGWARLQSNLSQVWASSPSMVVDRQSTQIRRKSASITYLCGECLEPQP